MTPIQWILGFIAACVFGWLAVETDREVRRRKRLTLHPTAQDFSPT